ncbi:MAG: hypothetical protein HYZ49_06035 [Chloroflexi bacterium]|nr:hypothetical protein [Chloroflexota bacterium]
MLKFIRNVGVITLVAVLTVVGIGALANTLPAAASQTQQDTTVDHGGRGLCGQAGLEAAAKTLGLTADELTTQLWAGESLANLADKAGVKLQDVQDAVTAACQEATRSSIEQAVTDGTLTRDHADWLLEGLEKGYWGGDGGFGFGPRGGGFGGRGGFGQHPFNHTIPPTSTPTSGSGA